MKERVMGVGLSRETISERKKIRDPEKKERDKKLEKKEQR
jgi:hypothetical protein